MPWRNLYSVLAEEYARSKERGEDPAHDDRLPSFVWLLEEEIDQQVATIEREAERLQEASFGRDAAAAPAGG